MKRELKMSHLFKVFLVTLLIMVIGIVLYLNTFALRQMRSKEVEKEQILLGNMVRIWDLTLTNNKIYIDNYMVTNKSIVSLRMEKNPQNMIFALQDIQSDLNEYSLLDYGMQEIFFYSGKAGEDGYLASYQNSDDRSTMMKTQIRQVIDLCEAHGTIGTWALEQWNGKNYLVYVLERNGDYMGCWATLDSMLADLTPEITKNQGDYHFFISNMEGLCLTNGYLQGQTVDLKQQTFYTEDESHVKYLQVSTTSELVPIHFVEHVEAGSMEEGMLKARNIMIFVAILLVISLAIWSTVLEYVLYRPIRALMANMSQISEGDFSVRIREKSRLKEIRLLYNSFNEMAHEIQNLKIAIYEKEINEQKAKLEYLQLQIHPHFLVNGLNSISAMIDMNKVIPAKEMCGYLADYYRYQYMNGNGLIPLQNELEHVDTYMNIQKMRHPNKVEYHCDVDPSCGMTLIPPILILTFVGNSFKYGMNMQNYKNVIYLTVKKTEGSTIIRIRDEGMGFPETVLEQIEKDEQIMQKDRVCIGIQNAFRRLKLFYRENVKYRVYNENGAVVEIEIPSQL